MKQDSYSLVLLLNKKRSKSIYTISPYSSIFLYFFLGHLFAETFTQTLIKDSSGFCFRSSFQLMYPMFLSLQRSWQNGVNILRFVSVKICGCLTQCASAFLQINLLHKRHSCNPNLLCKPLYNDTANSKTRLLRLQILNSEITVRWMQ